MANVIVVSETPQRVIIRDQAATRTVKVVAQGPQGPSGNVNPLMFQMLDQAQAAASSASASANTAGDHLAATSIRADEAASSAASALASEQASTTNATSAAQSAASASASATTAISSASSASLSASSANTSATNAQASANTATSKASEAATSATAAQGAAAGVQANAEASASSAAAAAASKSAAATSASNAASSATAAANSAASASSSATSASGSAATSATKASEASTSAANAAVSATTATTKASEASTSASNAATSATNAASSASAASASAAAAASSQSAAAASATNASSSATSASNSATAAATSATSASNSAAGASTSATNAASSAATAATKASEAAASATNAADSAAAASASKTQAEALVNGLNALARPDIRPSLLLDFANSKRLDSRITFTRASTATYWDGKTVALAEQNLLTHSQDFDNAAWNAPSVTKTANVATAPDGTTTADRLVGNTSLWYAQQAPSLVAGTQYTISAYVKSNTGSDQLFRLYGSSTVTSADFVATTSWQRFSFTFTATASLGCGIARQSADGVNDLLVWGFQLEQRDRATAYTPTTTQPITKYQPALQTAASGAARFDHNPVTGESLGLLIEEQRTNLLLMSQEFDNAAWSKVASTTITGNTAVAPDGAITADIYASSSATVGIGLYQLSSGTNSTTYTTSIYAKAGTASILQFGLTTNSEIARAYYDFNVSAGTVAFSNSTGFTSISATITQVGNGWYRCTVTGTTPASGVTLIGAFIRLYAVANVYIWGAQLEAGSFPTSYIPTTTAQVTRAADAAVMNGTNFSSWYRQDEGTLFAQAYSQSTIATSVSNDLVEANDGTQTNCFGTLAGFIQGYQAGQLVSVAANGVSRARNGVLISATQPTNQPPKTTLQIGAGRLYYRTPGWYRRIAYYPRRLSNETLQALTAQNLIA